MPSNADKSCTKTLFPVPRKLYSISAVKLLLTTAPLSSVTVFPAFSSPINGPLQSNINISSHQSNNFLFCFYCSLSQSLTKAINSNKHCRLTPGRCGQRISPETVFALLDEATTNIVSKIT